MQLFDFEGNQLRTIDKSGEAWFVLKDICEVLDLGHVASVRKRLSDDVVSNHPIPDALGRPQDTTIINEDGLYDVILESRKPEAKAFRKWITGEVVPTIRKHGAYMTPETIEKTLHNPDFIIGLATRLKEETARADAVMQEKLVIESRLKEQEIPVAIYNLAISAQNTQSIQNVAQALGTGRNRLFDTLREEKIIQTGKTTPYQRFIDAGYFVVRERPRASGDTVVNDPVTRVTAKGFDYIARLLQKRSETNELEA